MTGAYREGVNPPRTGAGADPAAGSPPARHEQPQVYRISGAPTAHTDDIQVRFRKYVISMLIRTVCFLLAVFVDHPVRWVFVAGAVFLPYIAVVAANAGREQRGTPPPAFEHVPEQLPELEAPRTIVLEGTVVEAGESTRP